MSERYDWSPSGMKASPSGEYIHAYDDGRAAAAEITRLQKELETALEALEPLALMLDAAELMGGPSRLRNDDDILYQVSSSGAGDRSITLGDMKRAREALRATKGGRE